MPSLAGVVVLRDAVLGCVLSLAGGTLKEPSVGQQAGATHPTEMHSCLFKINSEIPRQQTEKVTLNFGQSKYRHAQIESN